jgi:hypothetical protein
MLGARTTTLASAALSGVVATQVQVWPAVCATAGTVSPGDVVVRAPSQGAPSFCQASVASARVDSQRSGSPPQVVAGVICTCTGSGSTTTTTSVSSTGSGRGSTLWGGSAQPSDHNDIQRCKPSPGLGEIYPRSPPTGKGSCHRAAAGGSVPRRRVAPCRRSAARDSKIMRPSVIGLAPRRAYLLLRYRAWSPDPLEEP